MAFVHSQSRNAPLPECFSAGGHCSVCSPSRNSLSWGQFSACGYCSVHLYHVHTLDFYVVLRLIKHHILYKIYKTWLCGLQWNHSTYLIVILYDLKGNSSDLGLHFHIVYRSRSKQQRIRDSDFQASKTILHLLSSTLVVTHVFQTPCPRFVTWHNPNDIIRVQVVFNK